MGVFLYDIVRVSTDRCLRGSLSVGCWVVSCLDGCVCELLCRPTVVRVGELVSRIMHGECLCVNWWLCAFLMVDAFSHGWLCLWMAICMTTDDFELSGYCREQFVRR